MNKTRTYSQARVKLFRCDAPASADPAVYRSTCAYTSTDAKTGKPGVERGNWLLGYRRQPDGSWKVAWTVVSTHHRRSAVRLDLPGVVAARTSGGVWPAPHSRTEIREQRTAA